VIQEHHEKNESDFQGTVIDIETIGDFNRIYKFDSTRCKDIQQVIFGYINKEDLHIYCARSASGIDKLKLMTPEIITQLSKPFYAFNCSFESGVWFHHVGIQIDFDGELQGEPFESKKEAVKRLGISNYDDPFFDSGFMCMSAWHRQDFEKAIAHNRACLLKERDILLKRGSCKPGSIRFIK
jgi:hypothetical protein